MNTFQYDGLGEFMKFIEELIATMAFVLLLIVAGFILFNTLLEVITWL